MKKNKELIPKNTPYCHHKFKVHRKYGMRAMPCKYFTYKYNKIYNVSNKCCKNMIHEVEN